jgi:hypothetical protein
MIFALTLDFRRWHRRRRRQVRRRRVRKELDMFAFARSVVLKEKLGNEGLIELDVALDEVSAQWKEQVLETAADRFERRLSQEISAARIEIAASRLSIIRWVAGLLIAQAGVIIGTVFAMMTFLVNALKP